VSPGVAIYSNEFKDGTIKQVLECGYPVQDVATAWRIEQIDLAHD
jgi:transposase-like protein